MLWVAHAFEQLTAVQADEPQPIKVPKTELKEVRESAEKI